MIMCFKKKVMLPRIYFGIGLLFVFAACQEKTSSPAHWEYAQTLFLDTINPIGIAQTPEGLWLSDGDHNRLVLLDTNFAVIRTLDSLDRPMHIGASGEDLLVPQYGNDRVLRFAKSYRIELNTGDSLDAPAGIAAYENEWAVADFYNHRIQYFNGSDWKFIGSKGNAEGQFYYPTDVEITATSIWVADAYNNRVQEFDKTGQFVKTLGSDQKLNAATGLYVSPDRIFVTDFENSRVLSFDHAGALVQELKTGIDKPTDILVVGDRLYICNYQKGELVLYTPKADLK